MNTILVPAYQSPNEVKQLFTEYTNSLLEGEPAFKQYLEIQNYDEEVAHMDLKYGLPSGRLYLAYYDDELAGCIGLRKIDEENCEMKRLYVRPKFRGKQIGNTLVEAILSDARKIGYSNILLDTFPFLKSAIHMYKKYGFYEIPCYNDCPVEKTVYMKLEL